MKKQIIILSVIATALGAHFLSFKPQPIIFENTKQFSVESSGLKKEKDNPTSDILSRPSVAIAYSPHVEVSMAELERQFSDLDVAEVEQLIQQIDGNVESKSLIKKANEEKLTSNELEELTLALRKKAMLHKVLIERDLEGT